MGISTLVLLFYLLLAAAKLESEQANALPTLSQRKQESPIRTMKWKFRRQHAGPNATNTSTDQPSAPPALVHFTDEELREELALHLLQDSSDLKGVRSVWLQPSAPKSVAPNVTTPNAIAQNVIVPNAELLLHIGDLRIFKKAIIKDLKDRIKSRKIKPLEVLYLGTQVC